MCGLEPPTNKIGAKSCFWRWINFRSSCSMSAAHGCSWLSCSQLTFSRKPSHAKICFHRLLSEPSHPMKGFLPKQQFKHQAGYLFRSWPTSGGPPATTPKNLPRENQHDREPPKREEHMPGKHCLRPRSSLSMVSSQLEFGPNPKPFSATICFRLQFEKVSRECFPVRAAFVGERN